MSTDLHRPIARLAAMALWAIAGGCGAAAPQLEAAKRPLDTARPSCQVGSLRPSALPPTEGVWSYQSADGSGRVAVMLGPTELRGASPVVTRSVEAIETGATGERRSRVDTAVVHVDLLPPYGSNRSGIAIDRRAGGQAAAIYAITSRILIAAYEACAEGGTPAIRYLRRDSAGRVAVDAMLRRDPGAQSAK